MSRGLADGPGAPAEQVPVIVLRGRGARAVVAPRLGGRVLQFSSHGRDWLWTDVRLLDEEFGLRVDPVLGQQSRTIAEWFNYGGDKSWPAPQASVPQDGWVGPPDPVLDAGAYGVVHDDGAAHASVRLRSPVDPRTGLQIERLIVVHPDQPGLTTVNRLVNRSDRDATWAAWTITQVDAQFGGRVEVETEAGGPPPVDLGLVDGPPLVADHVEGRAVLSVQDTVGKIGFPAASGCLRYVSPDGASLEQRFAVDPVGRYPDQGSRAQVWMQYPVRYPLPALAGWQPTGRLIELECLSPLTLLPPGGGVQLTVEWVAAAPVDRP